MKSITSKKPDQEIMDLIKDFRDIYIIGCGTCTTLAKTGGKEEVLSLANELKEKNYQVIGWMIIPITCDPLTEEAIRSDISSIEKAEAILVTSCALGVQAVAGILPHKPVFPCVDTVFIGKEEGEGVYNEICIQCGQCVIGITAGICPITSCTKSLVNGACGGTTDGRCEISLSGFERPCAWTLIYERLEKQGRLEALRAYQSPKDWQKAIMPGKVELF